MKKILILGGGIAGVEAAIQLRKRRHDVTLISDRGYLFVYPTSIWIPVHGIDFERSSIPLDELARHHGFSFVQASVTAIHAGERRVEVAGGRSFTDFDYLVLALGQGKMRPQGIEHTLSICGDPQSSLRMRDQLDEVVRKGSGRIAVGFAGNPEDPTGLRGGPAFELLFNVDHMLRRRGIRSNVELSFFAPMEAPGARMGSRAAPMLADFFRKKGIAARTGKKIKRFEAGSVIFEDDSRLDADVLFFVPGGKGHAVYATSDLPLTPSGYVQAGADSRVNGFPHVFAIGDSAELHGPQWRAKQGHVAEVMAKNVARNIEILERGGAELHSYVPHVNILCVMDTGNAAVLVSRTESNERMLPLPIIGHLMKRAWGFYYRNSKRGRLPRLAGM